jgi:hypothetical protein
VVASLIILVLSPLSLGILLGPLSVGHIRMVEKQQRGETIVIPDVFSGFSSFAPAFIVTLVFFVCVTIASFVLVLPGLFLIAAWGNCWCFVALHGASTIEALGRSWNLFKAHTASVILVFALLGVANAVASSVVFAVLLTLPLTTIFATLAFQDMLAAAPSASTG